MEVEVELGGKVLWKEAEGCGGKRLDLFLRRASNSNVGEIPNTQIIRD